MTETEAAVVAKAEAELEAEARHDHGSQPTQAAGSEAEDTKEGAAVENEAGEGLALSEEAAAIVIGRYAKGYLSRKEVEAYEEIRVRSAGCGSSARLRGEGRDQDRRRGEGSDPEEEIRGAQVPAQGGGEEARTIDFEIALSRKFALKKVEAMSGAHGLDPWGVSSWSPRKSG